MVNIAFCSQCANYDGNFYNDNFFNCAIAPCGIDSDNCDSFVQRSQSSNLVIIDDCYDLLTRLSVSKSIDLFLKSGRKPGIKCNTKYEKSINSPTREQGGGATQYNDI